MDKTQYFEALEKTFRNGLNLMKLKNADYAGQRDPFKNFRLCEQLGVSLEQGILVRMSDKLARVANLLKNEASVSDESVRDTLIDLMNYSAILLVWKESQDMPPLKTPFARPNGTFAAKCSQENCKKHDEHHAGWGYLIPEYKKSKKS